MCFYVLQLILFYLIHSSPSLSLSHWDPSRISSVLSLKFFLQSQSSLFSASFASHLNLSYYSFSLSRFHFIIIIIIVNVIVILYTVAELLFSSWISSFVFVILCMCMRIFGFRSSVRLFVLLFVLVFLQMRERESGKGAREGENLGRIYTNTEPVKHFEIISVKWKMH